MASSFFHASLTFFMLVGSAASAGDFWDKTYDAPAVTAFLLERLRGGESSDPSGRGARTDDRLARLESAVRPMYAALPKNEQGILGHKALRYALHRLFVQQHGWVIRGLEPGTTNSSGSLFEGPLKHMLPPPIQKNASSIAEEGLGWDLRALAVFAAALEDTVHVETTTRLRQVFTILPYKTTEALNDIQVEHVLDTFMLAYSSGTNFSTVTAHGLQDTQKTLQEMSPVWSQTQKWVREVKWKAIKAIRPSADSQAHKDTFDFDTTERIVEEVVGQYGPFNDLECRSLKTTLLELEDQQGLGRVRLSDFYKKGKALYWEFNDRIDYLRSLGSLDESEPATPRIIVANYLSAWPQCLRASETYAVCCRNECEDLMGQIEGSLASPTGDPDRIAQLVATLSSDTVSAPRELSATLLGRLKGIAASNGGNVPIHGRLFAQWLHHAFPRECPYPHEAGTMNAQTPDQWMEATGQNSTKASEEEMKQSVAAASFHEDVVMRRADKAAVGPTSGGLGGFGAEALEKRIAEEEKKEGDELLWTETEELLIIRPTVERPKASKGTNGVSVGELVCIVLGLMALAAAAKAWSSTVRHTAMSSHTDECCV